MTNGSWWRAMVRKSRTDLGGQNKMASSFHGKVALVTGGTSGILARRLDRAIDWNTAGIKVAQLFKSDQPIFRLGCRYLPRPRYSS